MANPRVVTLSTDQPTYLRLLLAAWFLSAFFTKITFIPALRNNVGPFELLGLVVIGLFVLIESRQAPIRSHAVIRAILLMCLLAASSLTWIAATHTLKGLVQVLILFYLLSFLVVLYNLTLRYRISPDQIMTTVAVSVLFVGLWAASSGVGTGPSQTAGPFRNRAHMGVYMQTGFWLALIFSLWPTLARWKRLLGYSAVVTSLFCVATSGRRSVYISLFIGVVGMAAGLLTAHRGRRFSAFLTGTIVIVFLALLYTYADQLSPQTAFFKQRVSEVDDRVREAFASADRYQDHGSFFVLQRQGVMMAFRHSPMLGIGWGGFAASSFSPTGHEVHSMPLRFLAELGLVGLGLYLTRMGTLLAHSAKLLLRMRRTA